jgi:uncharacterized membrane protein YccC
MAKRKKRLHARHPEQFEHLDEELTTALDNLAQRNREAERLLGELAPEKPQDPHAEASLESFEQPAHNDEER